MKTCYTVTKIVTNSPETIKYSTGGVKERARVGFKAGGEGTGSAWPGPRKTSIHSPHCCWLSFGKKIKQPNFVMSYLPKSANSL